MDCTPEQTVQVLQRLISTAGGFLGGTSLLMFIKPTGIGDAFGRIVVSTATATMLTGFICRKAGLDEDQSETLMAVSFAVGFLAWNILGAIALYFARRQDKDVSELIKEVK